MCEDDYLLFNGALEKGLLFLIVFLFGEAGKKGSDFRGDSANLEKFMENLGTLHFGANLFGVVIF